VAGKKPSKPPGCGSRGRNDRGEKEGQNTMGLKEGWREGQKAQRERQERIKEHGKKAVKEQERKEKQEKAAAQTQQKQRFAEQRAFEESPVGRARKAHTVGQHYSQTTIPIEDVDRSALAKVIHSMNPEDSRVADTSDAVGVILTAIEAEGWKLKTAGFTFRQTAEASRDKFLASGQQTAIIGQTSAYTCSSVPVEGLDNAASYTFRAAVAVARLELSDEAIWSSLKTNSTSPASESMGFR
jgi:hypothetical protein